jgi:hypothetical protein
MTFTSWPQMEGLRTFFKSIRTCFRVCKAVDPVSEGIGIFLFEVINPRFLLEAKLKEPSISHCLGNVHSPSIWRFFGDKF